MSIGYKSQPLDFMIYQNGDTGPDGRSVLNTVKYYKLADSGSTITAPTEKDPSDWSQTPPPFTENDVGKSYFETTRTLYNTVVNGKDYSWSEPIENSMLTVDFINSLGITAKKIEVLDKVGTTVFKADGFIENPEVQIGGFNVTANKLTAGNGDGFISLQTVADNREYTPAEYIESNGYQYINTGIMYNPVKNYVTKLKIAYTRTDLTNQICGFSGNAGCGIGTAGNTWWEYNTTSSVTNTVNVNTIYDLEWTKGTTEDPTYFERKINGVTYSVSSSSSPGLASGAILNWPLLLLACPDGNEANGNPDYYCHAKLYSCQIYENGKIVRNLIPAFKENEFGLYDTCFGQFYKNQGTGKLSGAFDNEVTATITFNGERYLRLDYIQNNGIDNYIEISNLDILKTNGFDVEVEVEPTADVSVDSRCCILSNYSNENWNMSNISLELHRAGYQIQRNQARLYVDSYDGVNVEGVIKNQKNKIIFNYTLANCSCTVNNNTIEGSTAPTPSDLYWSGPFRIFVDNYGGGRFSTFNVPMKLYSMKIWSGGTKLAHYLPAMNSENVPGLINLVTGEFLTNAAGDRFAYEDYATQTGAILTDPEENSYRVLSYIETSGEQYIDTGVRINCETDAFEITVQPTISEQSGMFFGVWDSGSGVGPATVCLYHAINEKKVLLCLGGDTSQVLNSTIVPTDLTKHTYKFLNKTLYVDGLEKIKSAEDWTHNAISSLNSCIGAAYKSQNTPNWYYTGKIYGCKIWRNNDLIRDFIPVIQNESIYGLYDVVTKDFYSSQTSTQFTGRSYAAEFTAFYLGAIEPELAPFSVTNTGELKAEAGKISGFELDHTKLSAGNSSTGSYIELSTEALMLGGDSPTTAPFYVTKLGDLKADSGFIGGFVLSEDKISSTNNNLQLNSNGDFIAKAGNIGGFKINPAGQIAGLYSEYLSLNKEQVYFPQQAYFNLNDKVKIYSATPTDNNNGNVEGELTSYITTTNDTTFIIRNSSGAGLKFAKDDTTSTTKISVTVKGPNLGSSESDNGISYRNEHIVDGGYWSGSSYYYEAWLDYTCTLSSVQPQPTTVSFKVQVYDMMYGESLLYSATCTIPAYTATQTGSILIDIDATYTPGMTQYVYNPKNMNNPDAIMGMGFDSITRGVNEITKEIANYSTTNKSIYSLGHIIPNDKECELGSSATTGYWKTIHVKSVDQGSDRNLKNSIRAVPTEIDSLYDSLKPVSYRFNDGTSGRYHFGFIAQDVQQSLKTLNIDTKNFAPLCIPTEENTYMSLRYTEFIPLNTDQIQKLKKRVSEQDARIAELETAIKELQTK